MREQKYKLCRRMKMSWLKVEGVVFQATPRLMAVAANSMEREIASRRVQTKMVHVISIR